MDGRRLFSLFITTLVGASFLVYVIFQARFLLEGPRISLIVEPPALQTNRVVTLEGKTKNIVFLSLNGREIYTDKSGYFKEAVVLENGYTITTLEARDRYGRVTKLERHFVYASTTENITNPS